MHAAERENPKKKKQNLQHLERVRLRYKKVPYNRAGERR